MKLKSTLLMLASAAALQSSAQSWVLDSVEMGANYVNDVYYNMSTGADVQKQADSWDLGFQMTQFGEVGGKLNASVRANHINRDVQVYSLHKKASTNFGNLTAADTMVTLSDQLVNNDTSWGTGAFYNNRGTNVFDYGWGSYAGPPTHGIVGDSLYLVKADGEFYQVWIQEYVSFPVNSPTIGYKFRYAKWDGTGDKLDSVKRVAPYNDRVNAYYNLATGTVVDHEPARADWDIVFKRYQKDGLPGGQNPNKLQAYTGVLSNIRVEVAEVTGVNPNSVNLSNYLSYTYSDQTNPIGDDWKTFNGTTFTYDLDPNTSFIVKPDTAYTTEKYYQIQFLRFDGGFAPNTGKVVFQKRLLFAVSVNNTKGEKAANYSVYPNPAQNNINVMLDMRKASPNTQIVLMDLTGKVLQNTTVSLKQGVNAYSFDVSAYPSGTYMVMVNGSDWKVAEKLTVQH